MILSILNNLARQPFECPRIRSKIDVDDFATLYDHLEKHKMAAFTAHLTTCQKCKVKFTKSQLRQLNDFRLKKQFRSKLLLNEIRKLHRLFVANNISAVLPKELSDLPIYTKSVLFQPSSDIDILVSGNDFEITSKILQNNGWKLIRRNSEFSRLPYYNWVENKFSNKERDYINIDLQISVGKIHESLFLIRSKYNLVKLTEMLKLIPKDNGLAKPSREIQLIFASIHFILHDNFFGFRQAFEISELTKNVSESSWKKIFQIISKCNLTKEFTFVITVIENNFGYEMIPNKYRNEIAFKTKIVSQLFPFFRLQNVKSKKSLKSNLMYIYTNLLTFISIL